jgi:hypothetical protein
MESVNWQIAIATEQQNLIKNITVEKEIILFFQPIENRIYSFDFHKKTTSKQLESSYLFDSLKIISIIPHRSIFQYRKLYNTINFKILK